MAKDVENEDAFDEEELADGFDEGGEDTEEIDDELVLGEADDEDEAADTDDDADVEPVEDVEDVDESNEGAGPTAIPVQDEDDLVDDSDVELALDEVLAETILRKVVPDDDEDTVVEIDGNLESTEAILPKQDDEFRCRSCRLLKKMSQLADSTNVLCRDCV
ncbi:MAG: hypothetical protein B7Z69_08440 [Actinobacteria bacterium 21-73-9]|nr:MAG: hypothetical protein B7Z69_08440 [Actinobacteria bacterium 21-73-9]